MTLGVVHPDFTHLDPYNNLRIGFAQSARRRLLPAWRWRRSACISITAHGPRCARSGIARRPRSRSSGKIALAIAMIVAVGFMVIPIAALMGVFAPALP